MGWLAATRVDRVGLCWWDLSEGFVKVIRLVFLNASVVSHIFIYILFIICRFYTASKTHVGIRIVQTLTINLLTSIDPPQC